MNPQEHIHHLNSPMHAPFVSAILCEDLRRVGLTEKTPFHWKLRNGEAFIWSNDFDPDQYYSQSEEHIGYIWVTNTVPAYSAADIEKIVGDFFHIAKAGNHEVTCYQHRRVGTRKAPRYADALALIAVELLMRRIITPSFANAVITHQ